MSSGKDYQPQHPLAHLASLASIKAGRKVDLENRVKKKIHTKGDPVIHERLNLPESDKERRKRKKNHPTSGSTGPLPDGWSTASKSRSNPKDVENKD